MLTLSMIRRAELKANHMLHCTDCKVSGYSSELRNDEIFCKLEISHGYEERAEIDVCVIYPVYDKRRVRIIACPWSATSGEVAYYNGYIKA